MWHLVIGIRWWGEGGSECWMYGRQLIRWFMIQIHSGWLETQFKTHNKHHIGFPNGWECTHNMAYNFLSYHTMAWLEVSKVHCQYHQPQPQQLKYGHSRCRVRERVSVCVCLCVIKTIDECQLMILASYTTTNQLDNLHSECYYWKSCRVLLQCVDNVCMETLGNTIIFVCFITVIVIMGTQKQQMNYDWNNIIIWCWRLL